MDFEEWPKAGSGSEGKLGNTGSQSPSNLSYRVGHGHALQESLVSQAAERLREGVGAGV